MLSDASLNLMPTIIGNTQIFVQILFNFFLAKWHIWFDVLSKLNLKADELAVQKEYLNFLYHLLEKVDVELEAYFNELPSIQNFSFFVEFVMTFK